MSMSCDIVSWHRVTALCRGTELRQCVRAQSYVVPWHRVMTLCHGTELRHCATAHSYIVSRHSYDIVSKRSVTTLSWYRVTTLCRSTGLRHRVQAQGYNIVPRHRATTLCKAQRYTVMAQSYIVSRRSVTLSWHSYDIVSRRSVTTLSWHSYDIVSSDWR
jgi:malate/lactate dehydrogenase